MPFENFRDLFTDNPHLSFALSGAANLDRVLVNFDRLAQNLKNSPELLRYLEDNPRTLEILVTLFAGSQFLTEILLSHPDYLEELVEYKVITQPKTSGQFQSEALSATANQAYSEKLDVLRRYQRRELLHIGVCDLLGLFDLPAVTRQLSNLADGLVRACLQIVSDALQTSESSFAVIAMGKLGGGELNYSSDIDLLFLCNGDPDAAQKPGKKLIEAISKMTAAGFLYRVDMRLRPWGQVGPLVSTLNSYIAYLKQHARQWEKQALLKARFIAGDEILGNDFLRQARLHMIDTDPENIRAELFAMKQRTEDYLRQRGRQWGEVKLGIGSIRDIEFITQFLQLAHGNKFPEIVRTNTLEALGQLFSYRLLDANEYRVLVDGYTFLRTIEHHLQMMHYQQINQLPHEPQALAQLAQRLGFIGPEAGRNFSLRYQQHCSAIRAAYIKQVGNNDQEIAGSIKPVTSKLEVPHHVLQMHPSYARAFSPEEIALHAVLAEKLEEDHLIEVQAKPLTDRQWQVTIVAYDYPGELSLICGLLFAYNLNIEDGKVFTYEAASRSAGKSLARLKIVDVFIVRSLNGDLKPDIWSRYEADLSGLLRFIHLGQPRVARTELAKRVALALPESTGTAPLLYPIEIKIDNSISSRYTVLQIESLDTPGFLYEFTNALALHKVYIARMFVDSAGSRLHDTLYITNADGQKINELEKQRELRAAIVLIKHFTHLLPLSPNPESALLHFREFIEQLFEHPNWPDELASLERPEVLGALAKLLGVSNFLWDDFLRMQYENLFPVVRDVDQLAASKSKEQLGKELAGAISSAQKKWRKALNVFKDRELFRVDMRNILGYTQEFGQFSRELTDLAEVIVDAAYRHCFDELALGYGIPTLEDGQACPVTVCGLGKCGGRELGYASDIELIFIYAGNGRTQGSNRITTAEFYEKLVIAFQAAIQTRQEGIFHIDLQLRPYGKAGSMAVSLDAFRRYYAPEGPAWAYERQALVKLRPIAGDQELGRQIMAYRDDFVYNEAPFDVTAMRAMRERQIRHFVEGGTFNAKYSPGGLLDIEYVIQGLQITYGYKDANLRSANTREAMTALNTSNILSNELYARLRKAHTFLRWLIDSLRVVRGNAKDLTVPPPTNDEFAFLARRLHYEKDLARFHEELIRYTSDVQEISRQLFADMNRTHD